MTNIGLLPEDVVRKNIDKLMNLIRIKKELANKIPTSPVEKACLPIQRDAVRKEIWAILRYLRLWHVNVKECVNDENQNANEYSQN
jgi:hypothetical protein